MKLSFEYNQKKIDFDVELRKRKTLSIEIKPPGIIRVIAPYRANKDKILEIVKSKGKWITDKLIVAERMEYILPEKEFINGEGFLYLGKCYPLHFIHDDSIKKTEVSFSNEEFSIETNTQDREIIKAAMETWYRKQGLKVVLERVEYYKSFVNRQPKSVKVKEQKRRWGSCTSRGDIYLNWRCIMAPIELIDYIVVHEMCHLIQLNHSSDFWKEVKRVLPDYEKRKEILRNEGIRYNLE